MINKKNTSGLIAVLASLMLLLAACGDTNNTEELPRVSADEPVETPAVQNVCVPGETECQDTVVNPDVSNLPAPDGEDSTGGVEADSGMTIDGGLTISEALATEATGILAVKGHLFDEGSGTMLCEGLVGLGESYGCDGEHVSVEGLDLDTFGAAVTIHNGLTYTEDTVTVLGELIDGSLIVDSLTMS